MTDRTVRPCFDWYDAAALDRYVCAMLRSLPDDDTAVVTLVRVHDALAAELARTRCNHCGMAPKRRSGLCTACHMMQTRTGRLPDDGTLDRRDRRNRHK
jgi:hypothetical protein